MLRVSPLLGAVGTLFVLVGCKGPYSADGLCETYARAYCQFQYQCCNAAERREIGNIGSAVLHSNEEECYEEVRKYFCASLDVYAEAAEEGRIQWDEAAAEACFRPVIEAAQQCDIEGFLMGSSTNESCTGSPWVEGAVANGDTCYSSEECADDEASCQPNEPESEEQQLVTAKGTCTPPQGEGDSCEERSCRASLWCDYSGDTPTCRARLANGESCNGDPQCQSDNCRPGGTCEPKGANGESCSDGSECESDYCDFSTGSCANRKANGASCTYFDECESGYCDDESSTCKAGPENRVEYDMCLGPEA